MSRGWSEQGGGGGGGGGALGAQHRGCVKVVGHPFWLMSCGKGEECSTAVVFIPGCVIKIMLLVPDLIRPTELKVTNDLMQNKYLW